MLHDPILISLIDFSLIVLTTVALLFFKFVYPKRSIHPVVLFLLFAILPTVSLFRPGTFQSGDMRTHTANLTNFYYNLQDGIFFPRWAGTLCGRYGCPIYDIEYLLPYYIGSLFHFLGASFLVSIKLVLASSFVFSGITMYLWAKEEIGKKAGFIAAIFYLFAPYHLETLHFRGSVGEVLSFVFIPLVFLFAKKFIETKGILFFFLESIAIILLLFSHSSATIICIPLMLLYGVVVWRRKKNKRVNELFFLLFSVIYAMLLSMYYWLPAQQEVKYTWEGVNTFTGGFMSISNYIFSPIDFGLLFQGHRAELYPLIGYVPVVTIFVSLWLVYKKRFEKNIQPLVILFLLAFFVLFLLLQPISKPIWEHVSLLQSFIFVQRLLVPISFLTSFIASLILVRLKNNTCLVIICYLVIVSTFLNWANRKMVPEYTNPLLKENEFYSEYFIPGNPVYINRYNTRKPLRAVYASHPPTYSIEFLQGKGDFKQIKRTQESHEYILHATTDVVIRENTLYFPGWIVLANGKNVPINYENNQKNSFGILTFSLKKGTYTIAVTFTDTPVRSISKIVSLLALFFGGVFLIVYQLFRKNKRQIR